MTEKAGAGHAPPIIGLVNGSGNGDGSGEAAIPTKFETNSPAPSHPQLSVTPRLQQLPPELREITEGYASLGRIFERSAQDTYNGLDRILSDLESTQDGLQVDGDYGRTKRTPEHGEQKRLRWLDFANSHRERFMKMFVMLKWAQSSREPVTKLIDLRDWLIQGVLSDQQVQEGLMWNSKDTSTAKLSSPDIETALRLLSGEKEDRLPDVSYSPSPRITYL